MADEQNKEWRNLTFSQRAGKAPLPEPLRPGELTAEFRHLIWYLFKTDIERSIYIKRDAYSVPTAYFKSNRGHWQNYFLGYHLYVLNVPHDEIAQDPHTVKGWFRHMILEGGGHEVLTLVEFCLRIGGMPKELSVGIGKCFQFVPYHIDCSSMPVCIIPTTSEEMKEHVERSLVNINSSELTGAKSCLRNSSQELNNKNYAVSVRESIHAVEAAVRQIDPKSSNRFDAALDSLEENGMIKHPALKKAFKNLYGYTNDEEGIRHPLIEKESPNVGFDEAVFMYGACVSFVDYLVSKQRQLKE